MNEKPAPTILVVDDTEASRYAVSRILRKAQFDVREAGTGRKRCCWRPRSRTWSSWTSTCRT